MTSNHDDEDAAGQKGLMAEPNNVLDNVEEGDIENKRRTEFRASTLTLRSFFMDRSIISSEHATQILKFLDGQHILANEWERLRQDLRSANTTKLELLVSADIVFESLMKGVIEAGNPFWSSKLSSKHPNFEAMKFAPDHAARMLGVFDDKDKRDALLIWTELKDQVPKQGHEVWAAIEAASHALGNPTEESWSLVMRHLQDVYRSKIFLHQVSLLIKIVNYVGVEPIGWPEGLQDPLGRNQHYH
ncbi:hypothetical protein ACHAPO_010087 [Fusarium lateritium]